VSSIYLRQWKKSEDIVAQITVVVKQWKHYARGAGVGTDLGGRIREKLIA
jgi:hypothetical protein